MEGQAAMAWMAAAMSSGVAGREGVAACSVGVKGVVGEVPRPMAFTRMPRGAHSRAACWVKAHNAALAAWWPRWSSS